jgi:hypothetical protein
VFRVELDLSYIRWGLEDLVAIQVQVKSWRCVSIMNTGWDPLLGIQYGEYVFTDANGSVVSNQKTLAAIQFGQLACRGMDTSDTTSCIQQTYDSMGNAESFAGGHEDYNYNNISIIINGENVDTNPADFNCLGDRCGIFNSLDYSQNRFHTGTTFHVDMANVYFFPIGTLFHLVADLWGGNSWWKQQPGVPPFP